MQKLKKKKRMNILRRSHHLSDRNEKPSNFMRKRKMNRNNLEYAVYMVPDDIFIIENFLDSIFET